ncbi:MAG: transcriptional regulator, LacI family [Bryobacterales bacterium]|nr:transcriptional regulator, LacI family [Bryobacterales bacterium]
MRRPWALYDGFENSRFECQANIPDGRNALHSARTECSAKSAQKRDPLKKRSFKDVAALANVSPATVSRVAKGQANVDSTMRARVRKAAETLGVDLEQKRNEKANIIAFMLSNRDLLHAFQARILFGSETYCASQDRELLFMSLRYSPNTPPKELHLPKILNDRGIVRAMILGGTNSSNMLNALRDREIPFAVLGNNVIGDWNPSEFDAVYSDDVQGAFDLTSQLIADGHRDIWFIGDIELPWYARCAQGYRQSMIEAGLQPRLSEIHTDDRQLGYLAMRSIVSRREPVTAVFAGSDQIASGVYEALRQSGLAIPDDVSVAGFNDSDGALMDPPLTSVREFPEELGKHLAEFVLRRIQSPHREPQHLTIPTRIVRRQSTRPVSAMALHRA